jgi:ferrous iron transport protein A
MSRDEIAGKVLSLDKLGFGVVARVVKVEATHTLSQRLMEMGIVPGAPVCVIKSAPFGGPLEVRVRSYHLAIRRPDASAVLCRIDARDL